MKFFNKIKNLFKREEKASQIQALLSVGGGGAIWTDQDYENFAKETYLKNIISFRCIDYIARSVASVPWSLFIDKGNSKREEVKDHPIKKLLKKANPFDSFSFIMMSNTAFLVMDGNCYFERVGPSTGGPNKGIPLELYAHRPDRISILQNGTTGQKIGYKYNLSGRNVEFPVDPITGQCDLLHLKLFHPTNDWFGAGVTQPAAREIDISNEMAEWNKSMLQNEAKPGMLFSVKGFLTDEQYERLKNQIKQNYEGSKNVSKTLLLEGDGGVDAKPYSWSPKDIEYIEGGREQARRIALGYGVPPMLIGIPGDNTYSNYQEARLAFWEETIFFYLRFFKEGLNNWFFLDEEKLFIDYIIDDVPALISRRQDIWKRANESTFITINQKLEMVDLPTVGPEGDVILISASMVPLGEEPDMDETVEEEDTPDDEGTE